jgi:hypothetical protein
MLIDRCSNVFFISPRGGLVTVVLVRRAVCSHSFLQEPCYPNTRIAATPHGSTAALGIMHLEISIL